MGALFDDKGNYTGPQDINAPELDVTQAPPGRGAEVQAARSAVMEQKMGLSPEVQAMSGPERFGRAAVGALAEPVYGALEKAELAFPGKGQSADVAARIGQERTTRREEQRQLESTPGGMLGGFVGKGAPYALASTPAGAAGMAATTGFLGGGPDQPTGLFNELGTSGAQAAADALTAYLPAKGFQAAGKLTGAATGQLTKVGERAKEIEAAAARLGLPKPSFGQVYPQSGMATFEKASPEYSKLVNEQAEALYGAITKDTPYGVPDVGGKYLDELKAAVQNRYDAGKAMYRTVDDIVQQQGLGQFMPKSTATAVTNVNNPGYTIASEELAKFGFDVPSMAGMNTQQLSQIPLRFEDFNTMRVATNKAWGNLNRQIENMQYAGNPVPKETKAAKEYLNQLRTALDNDAQNWAKQNAGNTKAISAFNDATRYWKEQVVPTVVENPFARKVASTRRGFPTGESATRLSLNTPNIPLVDRLLPTMSRRGADTTEILRTLPEVRATALTGEAAQMPRGPLHAFAQAAEGRRDIGTLEKLAANFPVAAPGVRWVANTPVARRVYGARDVLTGNALGRAPAYGVGVPWGSSTLQEYGKERLHDRGQ